MKESLIRAWRVCKLTALIGGLLLFACCIGQIVSFLAVRSANERPFTIQKPLWLRLASTERLEVIIRSVIRDGWKFRQSTWIRSAEDDYPGLYSSAKPPPYYIIAQEDHERAVKLGLVPANSILPSYSSLTNSERMLLCYNTRERARSTVDRAERGFRYSLRSSKRPVLGYLSKELIANDIVSALPKKVVSSPRRLIDATVDENDRLFAYFTYIVPVSSLTGEVMRLDCAEFVPGQAWMHFVYGNSEWKSLCQKLLALNSEHDPSELANSFFIQYRIYGEKGVIAEGLHVCPIPDTTARQCPDGFGLGTVE